MDGGIWGTISGMLGSVAGAAGSGVALTDERLSLDRQQDTIDEEQRRLKLKSDVIMGDATASAASSGLMSDSGSISNYLGVLRAEMDRQAEWTKVAKEEELSAARTANDWKAVGSVISMFLGSGSSIGEAMASQGDSGSDGFQTGYDQIWSTSNDGGIATGTAGAGGSFYDSSSRGFKLTD